MNTALIPSAPALLHTAFYQFVPLADPDAVAAALRALAAQAAPPVMGSVLVAGEGINGMLAGTPSAIRQLERALIDPAAFGGAFVGMAFKHSECKTVPFHKLKVHVKAEIVPLGIPGVDGRRGKAHDVGPAAWRELIARDDVVLLDNRNSFEFRLGRFRNAIDPRVANFRDFPAYVRAHAAQWRAEGKTVAMYCTGGIRCEKTSAWMADLGLPLAQLEGGILNYFAQMPDAQDDWQGECFVFDNRVALDTRLRETATTLEDVYTDAPDGEWRLARARRLADAGQPDAPDPGAGDAALP